MYNPEPEWLSLRMRNILIALIKLYIFLLSPVLGRNCRFHPTCSGYAVAAIERHGSLKGLALAGRRILRCHPWHKGPYTDPVPDGAVAWGEIIGYKRRNSQSQDKAGQNNARS